MHTKICLVTGAGSGIGKATAMLLAEEDATVIVSDIDGQAAEQVAGRSAKRAGRAVATRLNVTDEIGMDGHHRDDPAGSPPARRAGQQRRGRRA